MSSTFGRHLRVTVFGQSHGEAVGAVLDGFPAGMTVDREALMRMMRRRAPGQSALTTSRSEKDEPEFLSGILNGVTTGQPISLIIRNENQHSSDYGDGVDLLRPGHADYTGHVRFFGHEDWRGGGSFSGRLTAPVVAAGALCRQWLASEGVTVHAHISRLGPLTDDDIAQADAETLAGLESMRLPTLREGLEEQMEREILDAAKAGDSVGGAVTCRVDGLPAGLGAPFFDSAESVLSQLLFSVPGIKTVGFGDGFAFAEKRGSEMNDAFCLREGKIVTATNHSGGINGGITNGMPLLFTCVVRPTPSIAMEQRTVSLRRMEETGISVRGRHDPCILPRVCPVIEAVTAIGLTEMWKERESCLRGS
ncbi:MAG: chorismate synthase [Clostridia bacterium]|nr:chorismate synthase [Clostridia bacterium]